MNTARITELKEKIATMETGLQGGNLPDAAIPGVEASLEKARKELADLEEKKVKTPKAPKKLLKKDFYTAMDKLYPETTLTSLQDLSQSKYESRYREMLERAKSIADKDAQARSYLDDWMNKHIPKGKVEESKPKTKVEAPAAKSAYSWKQKVVVSNLKPISINCQHYVIKVEKETLVSLKGTGSASIQVKAQAGEYLIFDDKGYLVYVMEPKSFAAKCTLNKTLADNKKIIEKTSAAEKALKEAQDKIAKLEKDLAEKEKPTSKTPKSAQPNKKHASKKSVCTLDEAESGRRLSKAIKFFSDHAEKWHASRVSWKITKIYRTKGEKQEIILETADYKGFATGLKTLIGGHRKYYRLCVDSFNLTKVDKPTPGSYVLLIKESEMKKIYTTKGARKYTICLKTYRELLKCSFEGSCTATQSAKWKKLYHECGDLQQKLEKQPEALRNFHAQVKKRRKAGELYSDAMTRVAQEIKDGKL